MKDNGIMAKFEGMKELAGVLLNNNVQLMWLSRWRRSEQHMLMPLISAHSLKMTV
jgi:hypothetical protein